MQHPFPRKNFDRIQKKPQAAQNVLLGANIVRGTTQFQREPLHFAGAGQRAVRYRFPITAEIPLKSTEGAASFGSQLGGHFPRAFTRAYTGRSLSAHPFARTLPRQCLSMYSVLALHYSTVFRFVNCFFSRRLKTLSAAGSANQIARARTTGSSASSFSSSSASTSFETSRIV